MTFELVSLMGAVAILFLLLMFQGALVPLAQGFGWGLGSRDSEREATILQGRARRTIANHLEGLAMFAPVVIVAHLADVSTTLTVWGAGIFLIGRAAFAALYIAGVPVLRSLAWGVSITGLIMTAIPVISAGL